MIAHHVGLECRDLAATEGPSTRAISGFVAPVLFPSVATIRSSSFGPATSISSCFKATAAQLQARRPPGGPGIPGWRHLAFKVDDVDAVPWPWRPDARITAGPMGFDAFIPGWRTVWVADPDGNIVEISQGYADEAPAAGAIDHRAPNTPPRAWGRLVDPSATGCATASTSTCRRGTVALVFALAAATVPRRRSSPPSSGSPAWVGARGRPDDPGALAGLHGHLDPALVGGETRQAGFLVTLLAGPSGASSSRAS